MRFLCTCAAVLALSPSLLRADDAAAPPDPDKDPQVFVKKGTVLLGQGDIDSALNSFDKALQLDPKYAPAYENRGEAHLKQGEIIDAIADFTSALQIEPAYDIAFYHRGLAETTKGDFDPAIADFDHMIELQPRSFDAYLDRARAKYLKGDFDGAIADTSESLALNPKLARGYFFRGLAQGAKGSHEQAADDFAKAAQAGMTEGALWFWVAKTEGHQTQDANPQDLLAQVGHPDPWVSELIDYVLEKTTDTQLLADSQKGKPGENRSTDAWFFIGLSRGLSGDSAGAQAAFQQSLAAAGDKNFYLTAEARRRLKNLQPPSP